MAPPGQTTTHLVTYGGKGDLQLLPCSPQPWPCEGSSLSFPPCSLGLRSSGLLRTGSVRKVVFLVFLVFLFHLSCKPLSEQADLPAPSPPLEQEVRTSPQQASRRPCRDGVTGHGSHSATLVGGKAHERTLKA